LPPPLVVTVTSPPTETLPLLSCWTLGIVASAARGLAVAPELTSIVSLMDATLNVACTLRAWRASSRTSASVKSENPAFLATIR